jgi:hypothetical protein
MLTLSDEDFLWFVDRALDQMVEIVRELGDEKANRRPPLPDANSPYVILAHCLGVMEFWAGAMIAGRSIERDRPAEFVAHGPVDELIQRTVAARAQLTSDVSHMDSTAPPRTEPGGLGDQGTPLARSQGGSLVHLYEELSQHLGQMELTRDLLVRPAD